MIEIEVAGSPISPSTGIGSQYFASSVNIDCHSSNRSSSSRRASRARKRAASSDVSAGPDPDANSSHRHQTLPLSVDRPSGRLVGRVSDPLAIPELLAVLAAVHQDPVDATSL